MNKVYPEASHLPGSYEWTDSKLVSTFMQGDADKAVDNIIRFCNDIPLYQPLWEGRLDV